MNTSTRRLLGGLATATFLLVTQGGFVRAASPSASIGPAPSGPTGNEMLSVQPSIISLTARPGATTTAQLTLRAAAALDVTIKSQGLAQGADGNFKSVPDAVDTTPFSARTMLSISRTSLSLHPGDKVPLTVSIAVPQDVGEGTRYAMITITGLSAGPGASSNVGFGVQIGVSTIVQIAGTAQNKAGEIKDINVGQALPGEPLPVTVSFLNTGNTHFGALPNELVTTSTLQDASTASIASANANGNQLSVIPNFSRDVALSMTPSAALVPGGRYHLEVGVGLKDGTIFDRKAIDFTWSGGEVLGETGAPIQTPPVASGQPTDLGVIIAAAAIGALAVALLFWGTSRARRRRRPDVGPMGR